MNILTKMKSIKALILFANPSETVPLKLDKEREIILEAIERPNRKRRIEPVFIEASTVHDLRRALLDNEYQIVHFSSHGTSLGLILEDEYGESHRIPQEALAELLGESPEIECVILNACYSSVQAALMSPTVPHLIAMQERLADNAAIEFSRGFYDAVGAGKNYAAAFRQGRINVKLTHPDALFPPILITKDGSSREAQIIAKSASPGSENFTQSENKVDSSPAPIKVGIPPMPGIFLGRDEDIETLKERLGLVRGGKDSGTTQILTAFCQSDRKQSSVTALRGFAGIGKTATATVLAEDADIAEAYPDGILWASLGQNPNPIYTMAKWGEEFGTEELYGAPTLREAVAKLSSLLRKKRVLMIVDDVWEAEHAIPFKQSCGKECSLLIATRAPQVVSELSVLPEAVHNLPKLTEEYSMKLLEILAPTVVPAYRKECVELVRFIECLPLAIHVAGRLLNEEAREVWGVEDLLKSLREGKAFIEAKATSDFINLETQTIPSVAALLQTSIDTLDEQTQLYFAYLAPYAEKPATFDLEALKASWQVEDPRPIIRQLTGRGLLEPVGNRYQMHSLLVALAGDLLEKLSKDSMDFE